MRWRSLLDKTVFALAVSCLASVSAHAVEYPIGTPQQRAGMEIGAVYLQAVTMEPDGMMRKVEESDIHLEADIHAMGGNPNGFEEGAWIPYLVVKYEVSKIGGDYKVAGEMLQRALPLTVQDWRAGWLPSGAWGSAEAWVADAQRSWIVLPA